MSDRRPILTAQDLATVDPHRVGLFCDLRDLVAIAQDLAPASVPWCDPIGHIDADGEVRICPNCVFAAVDHAARRFYKRERAWEELGIIDAGGEG